ncbi:MAG: exonuclease domain-containing protein [Bacteroidota bacterium]|nr:exonuclease domain-containing protein [Bacteroidota bacterium]
MFAIIDIETCGGKYEFRKGRITEICILLHDGLHVTDKFTTLLDPECNITPFFTNLTGITNDMVAGAPKFHEIAQKIWEMTENRIFVAHNVGFDYSFIKDEFASLGAKYKRETLCTVRLSRKLIPGKISYSLGVLCSSLGIENEARHRAEGDAVATAKLFDLLLHLKTMDPQYKNQGVEELMTRRIDKMKQYILDKLPNECGVYYFFNKKQEIIYIGKSVNVYTRALGHFNSKEHKSQKMLNDLYQADFKPAGSELIALLMEAEEIKKHKPKYNRMRKSDLFTHCIDWFKNDEGITNFKIVEQQESENALCSFVSYLSAREKLESWIDDHALCMTYTGLTSEDAVCFNHQIKKCNGICNGEEEMEIYNKRASDILLEYIFNDPDFVLIDKGRHHEERSLILIEKGHFAGYGYIGESETFSNIDEAKSYIKSVNYYPDADDLVRGWLKKNKIKKIVFSKKKHETFE